MLSLVLGELGGFGCHLPVAGQRLSGVLRGKLNSHTNECTFPCGARQEFYDPVKIVRVNANPYVKSYAREFERLINRILLRKTLEGCPTICTKIIDSEFSFDPDKNKSTAWVADVFTLLLSTTNIVKSFTKSTLSSFNLRTSLKTKE